MRKAAAHKPTAISNNPLVTALVNLSETRLVDEVLLPLLQSMDYWKVEKYHGPTERGKDIICWARDRFGRVEVEVIQAKKHKPSASASAKTSLTEIINQLSQAARNTVTSNEGDDYLPSKVVFVTPYPLEQRQIDSDLAGFKVLVKANVVYIDGNQLASLVEEHVPAIARSLCGCLHDFGRRVRGELSNVALMRALQTDTVREVPEIYLRLDIFVGRIDTRLLMHSDLAPEKVQIDVPLADIDKLLQANNGLRPFGVNLFEEKHDRVVERAGLIKALHAEIAQLQSENDTVVGAIDRYLQNDLRRGDDYRQTFEVLKELESIANVDGIAIPGTLRPGKVLQTLAAKIRRLRLPRAVTKEGIEASDLLDVVGRVQRIAKLEEQLRANHGRSGEEGCSLEVSLDGITLGRLILEKRTWFTSQLARFAKPGCSSVELRAFLEECRCIFEAIAPLLRSKYSSRCLGLAGEPRYLQSQEQEEFRLQVHIDSLIDTGMNLVILGVAGSGKTTSLQMYTLSSLKSDDASRLTLYIPLSRLPVHDLPIIDDDRCHQRIEHAVCEYLKTLGITVDRDELLEQMQSRRTVLLLDGVDEIIRLAPWVLKGIKQFAKVHPHIQIVVSSRVFVEYLDELPFFGVTLLPFTEAQRTHFVDRYLPKSPDRREIVLTHMRDNPAIAEIACNPLHATVLCVLAERGVPLPKDGTRLFEERFKLLLGHYDIHKGVRRIQSDNHILRHLSQRLAYAMHKEHIRWLPYESLLALAYEVGVGLGKREKVKKAVDELLDPCAILSPMTPDGQLGFGHLRFQEYLAAVELKENRNLRIGKLLRQSWWADSMKFFAAMASDLSFVLRLTKKSGLGRVARDTIEAMIASRPEDEQRRLLEQLDKQDHIRVKTLLGTHE